MAHYIHCMYALLWHFRAVEQRIRRLYARRAFFEEATRAIPHRTVTYHVKYTANGKGGSKYSLSFSFLKVKRRPVGVDGFVCLFVSVPDVRKDKGTRKKLPKGTEAKGIWAKLCFNGVPSLRNSMGPSPGTAGR